MNLESFPLAAVVILFLVSAGVIAFAGTRIVPLAEAIAVKSGIGQAIFGAFFVGITTSFSGSVLSMYSAAIGHPDLAISNAIGGIAAQTAFLAIGDITLRHRNLEHSAASLQNLGQGALLVVLLAIPLLAASAPPVTLWAVHPATPALIITYALGLRVINQTKSDPMWAPKRTRETQREPHPENGRAGGLAPLVARFVAYISLLGAAGFVAAESGVAAANKTGLSESIVGSVFTAVCTSLPELITTLTAIRHGALNLAVGNIIGGNSFDVLFMAGADICYREGSLYETMTSSHVMLTSVSIIMTGVLLLGMLRREKHGFAGIGFESSFTLALYAGMVVLLFL